VFACRCFTSSLKRVCIFGGMQWVIFCRSSASSAGMLGVDLGMGGLRFVIANGLHQDRGGIEGVVG
jgi:hypothetical protein